MKISSALYISLLALGLSSCSGGGGGGNGGNGDNGGDKNPQSKEEALQKLSPQHRTHFEDWQTKVVKACDSADAFGLNNENKMEQDGIDGAALIKKNNGSVVFSDGKNFAILTDYNFFSGVSTTKNEETSEINGKGYTISAETKREGSSCSVYLFGQKVYETTLAESFNIGTQYSQNKEVTTSSQIPLVKNLGVSGAAEVVQHGLYSLLAQSLKPSKEALTFIAQQFGLTAEQSAKLFKLNNYTSADSAVRFEGDPSAVWSNAEGGNLIAQSSNLKKYFDGIIKDIALEVRLQIPQFNFFGTNNVSDNGNIKLILTSAVAKKDNGFSYTLKNIVVNGVVAFDQPEAEQCLKDRLSAYLGADTGNKAISPSTQVLFSPCKTILPEIENQSYKNGFLKSLISVVFANVNPSDQFQYGGWEYVLSYFAKEVISQNKDMRTELDPSNNTKIVTMVANHLNAIKTEIEKSKNLQISKDVILQMGLDWSFSGLNVSESRITQIIQSVDNSADVFKVSSERLLNSMARNPYGNDDYLSFALGIDGNYKNEAQKALNLSKDLNYAQFESDVFNQAIQKKISVDEFKTWVSEFSTIKSEVSKYPSLSSVNGELVGSSLKWLKKAEVSQVELGGIYAALNNSIDPFSESTKQLLRDMDQTLGGNKDSLEFARNLTAEYKQLATSIRNNSAAAEYESWGQSFFNSVLQKRPSVEQLQKWNDLWSSALAFIQREKARVAGELGSMPKRNREQVIELAVKENWSAQDFAALEAIAPVAKSKITCDRYKDISSLADCAGMSFFSKGQKKFFDPAFSGRYSSFGSDFNGYMNRLSSNDWTSLRWALLGEFFGSWGPIWSNCDNSLFNLKADILKNQISAIVSTADQFKKWELERQIKETVKNCN